MSERQKIRQLKRDAHVGPHGRRGANYKINPAIHGIRVKRDFKGTPLFVYPRNKYAWMQKVTAAVQNAEIEATNQKEIYLREKQLAADGGEKVEEVPNGEG